MSNRNKNINAVIIDNAKALQKENIELKERIKELKKLVKESDSLPCVSDFAKSLLNQGDDLYERAKQARSEKEEALLAVESMAYKRIGKELMAHCR